MADREFRIKITTTSDTDGARETKKALDEGSESAVQFESKGREMREVLHKLNELAPGLGSALKAAFNPTAIGMIGLGLAIRELSGLLEELKQKAEEQEAAQAQLFKSQIQGSIAATAAANEYAAVIGKIQSATEQLKETEEKELTVLKAIEEGRKKILEAEYERAKAAAAGDPIKTAEVEARYGRSKSKEELDMEQAEINQLRANRQREQENLAAAGERSIAAEAAKERALTEPAEVVAARAAMKKYDPETFQYKPQIGDEALSQQALQARVELSRIEQWKKFQAASEVVGEFEEKQKKLNKAADDAAAEYKKAEEALKKTNTDIDTRTAVQGIHQQTASTVADEQARKLAIEAGINNLGVGGVARARTVSDAVAAGDALALGDKVNGGQQQMLQALYQLAAASLHSSTEATRLFQELRDSKVDDATKFRDLWNAINGIRMQTRSLNTNSP